MTRTGVRSRLLHWPGRSATRIAADVDDELRFHLDARAAELIAAGAAPAEALAQARREFGDVEYTRRYCGDLDRARERDGRRAELLSELRQDVVYGWRQLRKAPVFTLVAVITLALGIGANTAIFSVVNGVLLRPLPFAAADGLVRIFSSAEGSPRIPPSPLDVADWRAASRAFATIAAYVEGSVTLTGDGSDAERLRGARVSASLLPTLGVRPLAGRTFAPREDTDPPPREVVLSEALWGRRFGGDASVLGREIALDGERYRVIGIVPRGAEYPAGTELWLPLDTPREMLAPPTRGARYLRVLARLAPGVTLAQGQAEMTAIAARIAAQYPEKNAGLGASVLGLREYTVGDVRRPLLVLLGAVGLVMLIACANVANLLLVRAAGREGEIAIRAALGAGRGRLVRQLVTESVLLSLLGAAAAVALAAWGVGRLAALAHDRIPRLDAVRLDGTVLLATVAVAVGTGLLFGLIPAAGTLHADLTHALKSGGRGGVSRTGTRRARALLVVSELALSVVLLAGAGLLMKSFARLARVEAGFRPAGVATFTLALPEARYRTPAEWRAFGATLLERMAGLPGVTSAATASGLPLSGASFALVFDIDGTPTDPARQAVAQVRAVSAGYFATMGVRLARGRALTDADRAGGAPVAVINETAARRYFAGENPIGRTVRFRYGSPLFGEVVGVVADVRQFTLAAEAEPEVFLASDQYPMPALSVVMRSTGDPAALLGAARARVRELDADLPLHAATTMDDLVSESLSQPRLYMLLLGTFAGVALLLAAVGVYGVLSYAVSGRTREIGLRMALGATRGDVLRLVARQGLALTAAGVGIGLLGAVWATRIMGSLLYGVSATDAPTFAGVGVLLAAVAAAACVVPARRAARVDPMVALRAE